MIPGMAVLDYPVLSSVPDASFDCTIQDTPGFYADTRTRCQVTLTLIFLVVVVSDSD